jgi:hypothetical protein
MSEARRTEEARRAEQLQDQTAHGDGQEPGPAEVEADGPDRGRRRSKTMSRKEIARELRRQRALGIVDPELEQVIHEIEASRPRSRADCAAGPRPCMFVSCKHHLYLDVNPETGSIKINFPDLEPWELKETCALDVAERGGITLEEVGEIMNLTRERIRQVEVRGLLKLKMASPSPEELGAELLKPTDHN